MSKQVHIYTLSDPRTGAAHYVGSTINPVGRKSSHTTDAAAESRYLRAWKRTLFALGLKPEFEVVEVCTVDDAQDREQYWIDELRAGGANLLNQRPVKDIRWRRTGYKQPRRHNRNRR